jgi:hypothetical protein
MFMNFPEFVLHPQRMYKWTIFRILNTSKKAQKTVKVDSIVVRLMQASVDSIDVQLS